jgi:hypothetical protein
MCVQVCCSLDMTFGAADRCSRYFRDSDDNPHLGPHPVSCGYQDLFPPHYPTELLHHATAFWSTLLPKRSVYQPSIVPRKAVFGLDLGYPDEPEYWKKPTPEHPGAFGHYITLSLVRIDKGPPDGLSRTWSLSKWQRTQNPAPCDKGTSKNTNHRVQADGRI